MASLGKLQLERCVLTGLQEQLTVSVQLISFNIIVYFSLNVANKSNALEVVISFA